MASSEGEAEIREAYDDDFEDEDASDEDLAAQARNVAPTSPVSPERPPRPRETAEAQVTPKAAGRLSVEHRSQPFAEKDSHLARSGSGAGESLTRLDIQLENGRTFASAPSSGRRVVRGKICVGDERPGTGDSSSPQVTSPPVKDSRPLWLQHDEKSRVKDVQLPSSRPPPDIQETHQSDQSGRRARPSVDAGLDGTTGSDDPRKLKRLQQEIQRLSQRLAESEMYSAHDDGLPKFSLEEVQVGSMIAQGGFASVHHATWQCTPCALKKIFDPVLTEELKSEFENEVRMLRKLRHPNVVTLMAVCRMPPALSILTELVCGGSLFELLHGPTSSRRRDSPGTEPTMLLPLLRQAGAALAYLHAMMVVHRDIKSQNVLLTEGSRPAAKLCDFGLARMRSELCTGSMQWAGTAPYMAPELFAKRKYDETVDVFAFGTMVWEVVSVEIPHANLDPADIAHRVQTKEAAGLALQHSWPKTLKNLLKTALSVQQEKRPAMTSVVKDLEGITRDFMEA